MKNADVYQTVRIYMLIWIYKCTHKRPCSFSHERRKVSKVYCFAIICHFDCSSVRLSSPCLSCVGVLIFRAYHWRRMEARFQYWIGFNVVPWGFVIEKGAEAGTKYAFSLSVFSNLMKQYRGDDFFSRMLYYVFHCKRYNEQLISNTWLYNILGVTKLHIICQFNSGSIQISFIIVI